jgi:hypothetical protein
VMKDVKKGGSNYLLPLGVFFQKADLIMII